MSSRARNKRFRATVSIYGDKYTLVGDRRPEEIEELAQLVDQRMRAIAKRDNRLSLSQIAVLTAITLAEDLLDAQEHQAKLASMLEKELEKKQEKSEADKAELEANSSPEQNLSVT